MLAGEVYASPNKPMKTPLGYSGAGVTTVVGETTAVAEGASATITVGVGVPLRAEYVQIGIGPRNNDGVSAIRGRDNGQGTLFGAGIGGSVDYITGNINLTLTGPIAAGQEIRVTYQENYEVADDIPAIDLFFDSKPVRAEIFALKGTIGLFENFAIRKRFGMNLDESLAQDLVGEINAEMGGTLIRRMNEAQFTTPVDFYVRPNVGISSWEQLQSFNLALPQVEANMLLATGRGTISTMIAGVQAAAIIASLPGFVKSTDGNTVGPHVYGSLNGVTVIRVPDPAILAPWSILTPWKGPSPFEASAFYAPYMPLVVTSTLNNRLNPLKQDKAAATWAALDVLVPGFIGKMNVINAQPPQEINVTTTPSA